jgi:hypothetical protein
MKIRLNAFVVFIPQQLAFISISPNQKDILHPYNTVFLCEMELCKQLFISEYLLKSYTSAVHPITGHESPEAVEV